MKHKFLKIFAAAALCLLSACGDDESSEPTLEEKCATGLNEDCLIGTWQLIAMQNAADAYFTFIDFSTAPGVLTIEEGGNFTYTYSSYIGSNMVEDCRTNYGFDKGTWSIDAATNTITFNFRIGEQCNQGPHTATAKLDVQNLQLLPPIFQTSEDVTPGYVPAELLRRLVIVEQ